MSENKEYVSQIEGQSNVHISGDAICTVAAVAAVEVEGVAGLSNLGSVRLPEAMAPYVRRMDFIIGVQAAAPHGCAVVSWNGTAYINCIRNIREPELELHFYQVLHELGLPVKAESNQR